MQLVFETIYISQQVQDIILHLVNVAGLGTLSSKYEISPYTK